MRSDVVSPLAARLQEVMDLALKHPQGPGVARSYDRTFQFELQDGEPFFLELKAGAATVKPGDSGLDWKLADWRRATCIHTSRRVLEDVLAGRRLITEAYFDHELGYAPHRAATPEISASAIMAWFYSLIRLGREEELAKEMNSPDGQR